MDRERVVASILALLLVIVSICKAQRFRFLALYHVFERRQCDDEITSPMLLSRPELRDHKSEVEGEEL